MEIEQIEYNNLCLHRPEDEQDDEEAKREKKKKTDATLAEHKSYVPLFRSQFFVFCFRQSGRTEGGSRILIWPIDMRS